MLVISDALPINLLLRIGQIDLLPTLYGSVTIPGTVARELTHERTPPVVADFVKNGPVWLTIREPVKMMTLGHLGPGERAAISLTAELNADLLLMDDHQGRQAAKRLGLPITGTIGLLEEAARQNVIDLPSVLAALRQTDFSVSEAILEDALARHIELKNKLRP